MNSKAKTVKTQVTNEDLNAKTSAIQKNLVAKTWLELESHGKFDKNGKLDFIKEDMLIVGCDVGSDTHYLRAIDTRGKELSKTAFRFENNEAGLKAAFDWMLSLAAVNVKTQIVMGLKPTGHYWFCLTAWMLSHGITVVQVNPYAVNRTKEVEDNSQNKNDRKDPKVIANLVKDGNYGVPYLPEDDYATLRSLSTLRSELVENRTRATNRLHRELKIHVPEYKGMFGTPDGAFALTLLKEAPVPEDIVALGPDGIKKVWKDAGLRGRGYSTIDHIIELAKHSIGLTSDVVAAKESIKIWIEEIQSLDENIKRIEAMLEEICGKIQFADNIQEIPGIASIIKAGIIAEMGDIRRFDDVKELQKLSGLSLVACSSGQHKGETKISHRGRKRLRSWLYMAAGCAVASSEEFAKLHEYYTTRPDNPLKKKQSLIVIACKILRIIFAMLRTGKKYDPQKMMADIKRHETVSPAAAA